MLTGGVSEYDAVRALKVMDVEEESMCKGKPPSYFLDNKDPSDEPFVSVDENAPEEGDLLDSDAFDDVFYAIQHMNLDEDEALSFVADWQKRKRTWSENKELKNAMRKDRRHFDEPAGRAARDPAPPHRRKKNIAELKRITRCANCGEKGHWKAECDKPYKPRSELGKSLTAFAYVGNAAASSSGFSFLANFGAEKGNFLSIPPGLAIVDPGAAQDLIGEKAFLALQQRLAQFGLKSVILDEDPPSAAGIGGSAKPLYNALAPVFLGGVPGVVKLTVLAEEVPQLLSIGLLEHTKALIDTDSNQITFKALSSSAPMQRLESGHRALDIVHGATKFNPPKEVLQQFGLEANAFEVAVSEQYFGCQSDQGLSFEFPKYHVTVWEDAVSKSNSIANKLPWGVFFGIESDALVPLGNSLNDFDSRFSLVGLISAHEPIDHKVLLSSNLKEISDCRELIVAETAQETQTNENAVSCQLSLLNADSEEGISTQEFRASQISDEQCELNGRRQATGSCESVSSHVEQCKHGSRLQARGPGESFFLSSAGSHHTARALRRYPMLKRLLTYLALLSLPFAAQHAADGGQEPQASQRGSARVLAGQVVPPGEEAPHHEAGHLQHFPAGDGTPLRMCSSGRTPDEGGESTRNVVKMPSLPNSGGLCPLRPREPETSFEEGQGDPRASEGSCGQGEDLGTSDNLLSSKLKRSNDPCRTRGDAVPALQRAGQHHQPVADPTGSEPSPSPEPSRLCHADIGASSWAVEPDAGAPSSTGLQHSRPGDGESKWGHRVGQRRLVTLSNVISERPGFEPNHWFVAQFSPALCKSLVIQSCFTLLWHPPGSSDSFLVWHNPQFFCDLFCSDLLDDYEFFSPNLRSVL